MNIKKSDISFLLPLFFICLWGREYRGVSLSLVTVSLSIVISVFIYQPFRDYVFSNKNKIIALLIGGYFLINYLVGPIGDYRFSFRDFIEDIYSLFIFIFFYKLAFFYYEPNGVVRNKVNLTILIGLLLNIIVCLFFSDTEWQHAYFQRLWNPYLLAFIPLLTVVAISRLYIILLLPVIILLFYFSSSFQMAVAFLFLVTFLFVPEGVLSKINWRLFGFTILIGFVLVQIIALNVDPMLIAEVDHNFGVRAVFWHEALQRFLEYPLGFGFGVTVVSGDMSFIGESAFQGGADITDLGVHSGVMSILYKLGVFSIFVFYLVSKSLFGLGKANIDNRSYVVLLFVFLLSFFSNDSMFSPHFSASLGFVLGVLNGSIERHKYRLYTVSH